MKFANKENTPQRLWMCICLQTNAYACALNSYVSLHQSIKKQEMNKIHMWVAIKKWQCMKVENYTNRIIEQYISHSQSLIFGHLRFMIKCLCIGWYVKIMLARWTYTRQPTNTLNYPH
jgi:hypothetical protein